MILWRCRHWCPAGGHTIELHACPDSGLSLRLALDAEPHAGRTLRPGIALALWQGSENQEVSHVALARKGVLLEAGPEVELVAQCHCHTSSPCGVSIGKRA